MIETNIEISNGKNIELTMKEFNKKTHEGWYLAPNPKLLSQEEQKKWNDVTTDLQLKVHDLTFGATN